MSNTTSLTFILFVYLVLVHLHWSLDAWSLIDKTKEGKFDSANLINSVEDANQLWDIQNKLPYAEAVVMETLRMRPSVPVDLKWAANDDVLPDGNIVIKKGFSLYSISY